MEATREAGLRVVGKGRWGIGVGVAQVRRRGKGGVIDEAETKDGDRD